MGDLSESLVGGFGDGLLTHWQTLLASLVGLQGKNCSADVSPPSLSQKQLKGKDCNRCHLDYPDAEWRVGAYP